jgi:hypothetical protein
MTHHQIYVGSWQMLQALEVPHFSPGGERTDVALLWGQAKKSDVGMCI